MRYRRAQSEIGDRYGRLHRPVDEVSFLEMDDADSLWSVYLQRYHEYESEAIRWPSEDVLLVDAHLHRLTDRYRADRLIWIPLVANRPVPVEVQVEALLQVPLGSLVSEKDDFRLASRTAIDGFCLELTHLPGAYQFEMTAWGEFGHPPG
jgi:hypothetical protein